MRYSFAMIWFFLLLSCSGQETVIRHGNLVLSFNQNLHSSVSSASANARPLTNDFSPSEFLQCRKFDIVDFEQGEINSNSFQDSIGNGKQWILKGRYENDQSAVEKVIS